MLDGRYLGLVPGWIRAPDRRCGTPAAKPAGGSTHFGESLTFVFNDEPGASIEQFPGGIEVAGMTCRLGDDM